MELLHRDFKCGQVLKLTGINRSKLDRIINHNFLNIHPRGSGCHVQYTFANVFRIKLLIQLQAAGLSYKSVVNAQRSLTNNFIYATFTYVIDRYLKNKKAEPTSIDDICPKSENDQIYRNMHEYGEIGQGISVTYNAYIIANDLLIKYFEELG